MSAPLLTCLALLPLLGSLLAFGMRGATGKMIALVTSLLTAVFGLCVFFLSGQQVLSESLIWIPQIGAWYALSLDGMGRAMVLLTVLLVPIVLLAEWENVDTPSCGNAKAGRWKGNVFGALALMLESFALFVFMSADVLLFYIFFEATLIPMYFLIAGWGGHQRGKAAMKFLLYSLAGGLVMLVGVVGVYIATANAMGTGSFLLSDASRATITPALGTAIFASFFFAFAVKAPMVPVHTWLPDTTEQATPGASTLLVGVLDKIGTFGMIRLCLGVVPEASVWATPFVVVLAVISIVYGAFMAIRSTNLLRLVAYTSVSHFGYMVLGIWAFTSTSMAGSMYYMLAHGFSSAAMFIVVGFLVNRRGSAEIADFGGIQPQVPLLAGVFLVSGLATLGLPGTANFVGEFSIMAGAWPTQTVAVIVAVFGTVLAAVYVLWAYQRVFTGAAKADVTEKIGSDLDLRERLVIAPLIALILFFGFMPNTMLDVVKPVAEQSMTHVGLVDPQPGSMGGK